MGKSAAEVYAGRIHLPEVSGSVSLPGDNLLLASDEYGVFIADGATKQLLQGSVTPRKKCLPLPIEDCEDACVDADHNHIYLISSHSRNRRGKVSKLRYRLARLSFGSDGKLDEVRVSDGLLWAILTGVPELSYAILDPPARGGLNIEGFAWDPDRKELVVGLRSPTYTCTERRETKMQEDAMILRITNPREMFKDPDAPACLDRDKRTQCPFTPLDLQGQGIRGLAHDPHSGGFWILSGFSVDPNHEVHNLWRLWFWDGKNTPQRVKLPDEAKQLKTPEAISLQRIDGVDYLLFIEDRELDGTPLHSKKSIDPEKLASENKGCPYLLIPVRKLKK